MGRRTPLYGDHEDRGASFTDFGGWDMPVEFDSIRTEHAAVREAVGAFDVSHMGEIEVSGPGATALMNRLTTNDVGDLTAGDSQYTCLTTEDGIMLDDTVVYRLPDGVAAGGAADAAGEYAGEGGAALDAGTGDPAYLFVPNAGHDAAAHDRWTDRRDEWGLDATVENVTESWAMIAVQGPDAPDAVGAVVAGTDRERVLDRPQFGATYATVAGVPSWVARTGYTGEDGFELLAPADAAETVWDAFDCQPCGLGARDTLRIERGFLLSGQDFDPETEPHTPYEAGIGFTVALDTAFVGRDALARQADAGVDEAFTGIRLTERGVAREGHRVYGGDGGTEVGHVTSGTMSPTLNEPVALGYLDADDAEDGRTVTVEIRGERRAARVESPPFVG